MIIFFLSVGHRTPPHSLPKIVEIHVFKIGGYLELLQLPNTQRHNASQQTKTKHDGNRSSVYS